MASLLIDGIGGTQIVEFDGDPASLQRYEYLGADLTALAHRLVPPTGRELIIGPGGGVDVLQAVREGRTDVTVVEINPLIVGVVNDALAGFSGSPYRLPGVRTVVENGRTFVQRSDEKWDLIALTWVDTGGSATALAFSENYLYTVEAYQEFIRHLTPEGSLVFLRAVGSEAFGVDSLRGIAVARQALNDEGVDDASRQILVAASSSPLFGRPMCFVAVKKTPFTTAEIEAARAYVRSFGFIPIWLPDSSVRAEDVAPELREFAAVTTQIVRTEDLQALADKSRFDIEPATDDNPFYFVERGGVNRPVGVGVLELRFLVGLLVALLIPFVALPLAFARRAEKLTRSDAAALAYFFLLGVSFMLVEIELFHVFALILGSPTITLCTVLAGVLSCSGVGSLVARRLAVGSGRALAAAFAALVVLLVVFLLAKGALFSNLVALPLAARVALTLVVIAPVAFLMGLPMAAGMTLVARKPGLVMWGWALNGASSVLASAGAVYAAIHLGTAATFAMGALGYAVAGGLVLVMKRAWRGMDV
jgi:hypothetical protein